MDRPNDLQEILDRMSKDFRPNVTKSFQLNQIEFLRKLGQGMSAKVFIYFPLISFFIFLQGLFNQTSRELFRIKKS